MSKEEKIIKIFSDKLRELIGDVILNVSQLGMNLELKLGDVMQ